MKAFFASILFSIILWLWSLACSAGFILSVVKLAVDIKITWSMILLLFLSGPITIAIILTIAFLIELLILLPYEYIKDWLKTRKNLKGLMNE